MDITRTQQASLYLASKIPDLYVVKFLKLLYYLDFIAVRETGKSVTGDTYFHLPYGPIPSFIKDNIDLLDLDIKKRETSIINPNIKDEPSWLQVSSIFDSILKLDPKGTGRVVKPKDGVLFQEAELSQYEKVLLDDIINKLGTLSVSDIVAKTHQEAPYTQTLPRQIIPYDLAFQLDIKQLLPDRKSEYDKEIAYSRFITN